jgi:peptidoglycan hydrolase-like protein with peptidoglycan-binding domain
MRAVVERKTVATEFQHQLQDLKQLEARIAATDERIAVIREVIRGFGCRTVAQALEGPPAGDGSTAPHPSDSPRAGGAGLLPWVFVVAVATLPILFVSLGGVSLGGLKPQASNNRPPDARWVSSEPTTTAISPRDNQQAPPDIRDTDSGLRQPEPSTDAPSVAPPQEATTSMAIRSTLPPSEDDPLPVAPPAALLPPPIATPGTVTTVTFPRPLLDLAQTEDAKRVQRRLIELGFLFGTADGHWGPRSLKALRDFRSAQGIGNSDTWDEKAQQDLFSAAAARTSATETFVGGWGISADQCRQTLDSRSRLKISTSRAEAFNTTCQFNSTQRESANEWRIRAACADEHDRWNANIRLTLAEGRLTWTSERGTATYLRCPVVWN